MLLSPESDLRPNFCTAWHRFITEDRIVNDTLMAVLKPAKIEPSEIGRVPWFRSVAVVGLGKLGLPLSCTFAVRATRVFGIDVQLPLVEAVNRRQCGGDEPLLADLLKMCVGWLTAATNYGAIRDTEAAFIVVPTPSDAEDRFSLAYVLPAVRAIAREVADAGLARYTIVLVSTVMPGACEGEIIPAIKEVVEEVRSRTTADEDIRSSRRAGTRTTKTR